MRYNLSTVVVCVTLGYAALFTGQTQVVRATLSEFSTTQCRGYRNQYQLFLSARFVIENTSDKPLLISNRIELTPQLRAATSEANARKSVFLFDRSDEYGGLYPNLPVPDFSAFRVLQPGEKATFLFDPVELTVLPNWYKCAELAGKSKCVSQYSTKGKARTSDLEPGKAYWLQIGFYTLPKYAYWNREEFLRLQQSWSSGAQISEDLIWTEPFRFVVEHRDLQAPTCE